MTGTNSVMCKLEQNIFALISVKIASTSVTVSQCPAWLVDARVVQLINKEIIQTPHL